MHKVIQYSFIFLLLATVVSIAMGDAFDQTVEQIKTLEAELEQNRETALQEIEKQVAAERETNPLNAPKDQFESNEDYSNRQEKFHAVLSGIYTQIWEDYLETNKDRKNEVAQLYNGIFQTNALTVILGTYDADREYFQLTVEISLNDESQNHKGLLHIGKDDARNLFNNWDQVIKTGYLSIGPGYRRNLIGLKLENLNSSKKFVFYNYHAPAEGINFWRTSSLNAPLFSWTARIYDKDHPTVVAFSPNGAYVALSGVNAGDVHLWSMSNRQKIWSEQIGARWGHGLAFNPNGAYLVTHGYDDGDRYVGIVEALSGHVKQKYPTSPTIKDVTYSPHGQSVAIIEADYWSKNSVVRLWKPHELYSRGWRNYIGEGDVESFAFSPNGDILATGSNEGIVRLWNISTWWTDNVNTQRLKPGGIVRAVAFSPNGKYLATDGYNGGKTNITFWEVSSGKKILKMEVGVYEVYALAFSPCGEYLAVGSYDPNRMILYRIGTKEIAPTTDITEFWSITRQNPVMGVAWSPNGNYISDGLEIFQTLLHPEVHNLNSEIIVESDQNTTAANENEVVVRLTPDTLESPSIGTQLSLNLDIVGAESITGYQATVTFDSTALRYVESENGGYLPSGAFFIPPIAHGNTVTLAASSLAGESSGDGTLATITFEVVAAKASTVRLSDVVLTNSSGGSSVPEIENAEISEPPQLPEDVNKDGVVNIIDLTLVASKFGNQGQNAADVNADGVVNIIDLTLVAAAFGNTAAAPITWYRDSDIAPTRQQLQQWLREAHQLNLTDPAFQRGILVLEQLLAALTPKETALLPNYPNPFNPETWIPYQLAEPANIRISIYVADGKRIRTLDLGHQPVGIYESRSRAAYWDGKNSQGELVASGVYFYTLTAGEFTATLKMLIRK